MQTEPPDKRKHSLVIFLSLGILLAVFAPGLVEAYRRGLADFIQNLVIIAALLLLTTFLYLRTLRKSAAISELNEVFARNRWLRPISTIAGGSLLLGYLLIHFIPGWNTEAAQSYFHYALLAYGVAFSLYLRTLRSTYRQSEKTDK